MVRSVLIAAVLTATAACGSSGTSTSTTEREPEPTTTAQPADETSGEVEAMECSEIRAAFLLDETQADFDYSQELAAEWRSRCAADCGDMVEDTDTPEIEARDC